MAGGFISGTDWSAILLANTTTEFGRQYGFISTCSELRTGKPEFCLGELQPLQPKPDLQLAVLLDGLVGLGSTDMLKRRRPDGRSRFQSRNGDPFPTSGKCDYGPES